MAFIKFWIYFYSFILSKQLISVTCTDHQPDITLLGRNNDFSCIIGSNEVDKAATLSSESFFSSTEFRYRNLDGLKISEENNCDFENGNECSKKYSDKNWDIVQTEKNLLPIIHDIRFEGLPSSTTRNSTLYADMKDTNFYFPISVRADDEPEIMFCSESNNIFVQCYWIRIERNEKNLFEIAIQYCGKVHKEFFSISDSDCVRALPTNLNYPQLENNLMNNLDWLHFITVKNQEKIFFKDGITKEEYFTLDNVTLDIKKIYLRTSDYKTAEWRMHKNSHLKLKTFNTEVQLGPTFATKIEIKFCISMMVHICNSCSLDIRINNEEKQKYYSDDSNWQNIKLVSKTNFAAVKIFVKGNSNNNSDNIVIDNIRQCHEKEIRILTSNVSRSYEAPKIYCKILSYPTWYASYSKPNTTIKICDNEKYIGKNCDIPCSAIFGPDTDFCNKNIICKSTENINQPSCACASGYTGPNCEEICTPNSYGYNCQNRCGQCKNNQTCLKSSGICPQSCKDGFVTEKCTYKKYEPVDLICESNADGLINITWSHPKTTEYITAYTLLAELMESEVSSNFSNIQKFVRFPHRKEQYMYILEKPFPLSSSYSAGVCGNGKTDQCTKCNVTTPPVKPKLQENFITEECVFNDTKIINIPGIIKVTNSKNSSLYITVCNITSENENLQRKIYEDDELILSKIFCSQKSWIAGKIKMDENEIQFIVGAGKNSTNIYENPPLENIYYNSYNICVVLTNEYKNLKSFNVYCEYDDGYDYFTNLMTGASVLGILLLGIIIFFIVCGVKTVISKKSEIEEHNIPELSPLNSNIQETRNVTAPSTTDL